MSRILTFGFKYDDSPWQDVAGNRYQADVIPEVMDTINDAIRALDGGNISFVDAKLDGCLFVDRDGTAPDEAASLHQYEELMRILNC